MEGIDELFSDLAEQAASGADRQLELFVWAKNRRKVEYERERRAWIRRLAERAKPVVAPLANPCAHHSCPRERDGEKRLCAHHLALNAQHAKAARMRRAA
jgi:hypothetical protein